MHLTLLSYLYQLNHWHLELQLIDTYFIKCPMDFLIVTHIHAYYGFLLLWSDVIFFSWGTKQTTGKVLKLHAGWRHMQDQASSLNPTLKSMFRFYHQLCYWFNTCNYRFNGKPSVSTIRNARVAIKYRPQICSQSACVNSSIWIFSICYW